MCLTNTFTAYISATLDYYTLPHIHLPPGELKQSEQKEVTEVSRLIEKCPDLKFEEFKSKF